MIGVSFDSCSVPRGHPLKLMVRADVPPEFYNMQADLWTAGTDNPSYVLAHGCQLLRGNDGTIELEIPTVDLPYGIYELFNIGFHPPMDPPSSMPSRWFRRKVDFGRVFIEIREESSIGRDDQALFLSVLQAEDICERRFLSGITIEETVSGSAQYQVLAIVEGVAITRRFRFDRWEVFPYRGVDGQDHIELANELLKTWLKVDSGFTYSDSFRKHIRSERPVCVVHFPNLIASDVARVQEYCYDKALLVTEALSYQRGGSGAVVCVILRARQSTQWQLFYQMRPYRGNLIGGGWAGEEPEDLLSLIYCLQTDDQLRYYLSLYKQACNERNPNFEFLRYWQLLETIAEAKNYDPNSFVVDQQGQTLAGRDGRPIKAFASGPIACQLISTSGMGALPRYGNGHPGNAYSIRDYIYGALAMRNATAHYGGFRPNDSTQRKRFRDYDQCAKVYKDQGERTTGFVLDRLKDMCKWALTVEIKLRKARA